MAPPQRQKAAEIDTTLPYQNVKAAVRMFGEKADSKVINKSQFQVLRFFVYSALTIVPTSSASAGEAL